MKGTECRTWWDEHFPGSAPIGFVLRQIYADRWLRIHSLPESKRYADTEDEYAELLHRHNKVATDALGDESRCCLIEGSWDETGGRRRGWVMTLEGMELPLRLEVMETVWGYGRFDALLREVADEKRSKVLFASRESGRIYAPYDGGADIIYRDGQERDAFKQAYRAWLSKHLAGL